MGEFAGLLPELERAMREAGEIAEAGRVDLVRELKPDGSIVTSADREIEMFLRDALTGLRPGSTVWGEEFGFAEESAGGLWLVDPIDGTSNYAFGSPLWGISVALAVGDEIEVGAILLPDLKESYLCARGHGGTCNGAPLAPIPPGRIRPEELISYSTYLLREYPHGSWPGKPRHSGAFVIDGTFTAQQRFRGLVGIKEKLYDIAASVLLCRELGADIRYADGSPLSLDELKKDEKIRKPWVMFPQDSGFVLASGPGAPAV